ncbi:MAG: ATP-binding protein [Promethearchaeota archaeon]|nr:MAG: ATP-binding protein [Candidatus Lokiarchaeota archaeon]
MRNSTNEEEAEERLKYTDDNIKELLGRFGAVYFPSDVKDSIEDIIGNEVQKELLEDFFKGLKKYDDIKEQLKKANLIPNLTILLYGPPGTGKTTLTRAFAKEYKIPVCIVESNRLISPLLGDTIKSITRVVELAADIASERGAFILFFDEIDAVGSERSNIHEVGEIKRAVISFLQVIDRINYEGYPLAIIGATNHQHLLDSAIWRRFTFHLSFEFPDYRIRKVIIELFIQKVKKTKIGVDESIQLKLNDEFKKIEAIENDLEKKLGHRISEFDGDLFWKEVEKNDKIDGLLKITHGYTGSDIQRGIEVALFKIMHTEILTYEILYVSLKLVGGTASHVETQDILSSSRQGSNKKQGQGPPEI